MNFLLVFLGGGLGALSRFTLTKIITDLCGIKFPLGILTCNLLGCFLIGLAAGHASKTVPDWFAPSSSLDSWVASPPFPPSPTTASPS